MDWIGELLKVKPTPKREFPPVGDFHGVNTAAFVGFDLLKASYFSDDSSYDKHRKLGKTLGLALCYGGTKATVRRAFPEYSDSGAQKLVNDFFSGLPVLKEYMKRIITTMKEEGYVTTFLGRKIAVDGYDETGHDRLSWARANDAVNSAYNYPIQGAGGELVRLIILDVGAYIEKANLYKYQGNNITRTYHTRLIKVYHEDATEDDLDDLEDGNCKIVFVEDDGETVIGEYYRGVKFTGGVQKMFEDAEVRYEVVL